MQHLDFCKQILELSDPWQVDSIKIDQPSRRLDIYLGFGVSTKKSRFSILPPNGLFGTGRQPSCPHCHAVLPRNNTFETVSLRHLPIAGMRTYLHVPAPGTVQSRQPHCFCMRKWAAANTEFTEAMRDYVLTVLRTVPSGESAAQLAGVSYSEVRQICKACGFSLTGHERPRVDNTVVEVAGSRFGFQAPDSLPIPEENHPGWSRFIDGELTIQAESIALRMLLQRMHADREKGLDEQARRSWIRLLRSFFIKNQQLLKREINLLHGNAPAAAAPNEEAEKNVVVPREGDRVWQALINGEIVLPNDSVSLKMLLTRIRQVITRNPTEANRREGASALRQYFLKNQQRLTAEIRVLKDGKTAVNVALPRSDDQDCIVPSIAHPGWQRLIDGEIRIATDTVALRMLLGRIRQSLEKNQSVSRKLACTQLLRNYFLKHQNRHRKDLEMLTAS